MTRKIRRIKKYGFQRKNMDYDVNVVRENDKHFGWTWLYIGGYFHVWHILKLQGIFQPRSYLEPPRSVVSPERVELRLTNFARKPVIIHGRRMFGSVIVMTR